MSNKHQKQQGDVLFTKVKSIPQDAKRSDNLRIASGEKTGHHHEVLEASFGAQVFDAENGVKFVKTTKAVTVKHPEHGPVTLEPGIWKTNIVREHDYFLEMERKVQD